MYRNTIDFWILIFYPSTFYLSTEFIQFCSVTQSFPTLCDPHGLQHARVPCPSLTPKLAQTHVHWVRDAIQPSHPLSSPLPALSLSQHRIFSSESVFHIRWPKYWSISFITSPSNEYLGLISFSIDLISFSIGLIFLSKGLSKVFSNITVWRYQIFGTQTFLLSGSHTHTWLLEKL